MLDAGEISVTGVARGGARQVLGRIAEPGQAAAIWTRGRSRRFADWIDALPAENLPGLRVDCPVARLAETAGAACETAGLPASGARGVLCADIALLGDLFARVMGCDRLRLRLDVVNDDACARFHLDNVPARLLCTYRGSGTEYGLRRAEGDPDPVARMRSGDAGLFRGGTWPGAPRPGLVHRSPPIAGTGATRLLLVMDLPAAG